MNEPLDYRNKVILAPMVRVGTTPMRLLCKRYGADIVYSEELVDRALQGVTRVVNEPLGTVDFVRPNGSVVFRTCPEEQPRCVFQLGSNNAVSALETALKVHNDVAAIDLNMGCPKHFSVHAGMGSALLSKPETVYDILTTLVRNIEKPVTCKIRLKDNLQDTISLIKLIESTGVKAVTIHCRYISDRPKDNAHWDILKEVISGKHINIPIIANGDVFKYEDIEKMKEETGADSVMIARGACKNPSIFRPEGPIYIFDVIKEYIKLAIDYDMHFTNTKYNVLYMTKEYGQWLANEGKAFHQSRSMRAIAEQFELADYYDNSQRELKKRQQNYNFIHVQPDLSDEDTA